MAEPLHFRKTRIAPTPSGYLHLGNALSFALTAALAKKDRSQHTAPHRRPGPRSGTETLRAGHFRHARFSRDPL